MIHVLSFAEKEWIGIAIYVLVVVGLLVWLASKSLGDVDD